MKCCHLLAALALAGCGLDTGALPSADRALDAGPAADSGERGAIAGSPASWPSRRRPGSIAKDGGTPDTNNPPSGSQPSGGAQPSAPANVAGQGANPGGGQAKPTGSTPSKGGQQSPGAQAGGGQSQPSGANQGSSGSSSSQGSKADAGSSSSVDAGAAQHDAGSSSSSGQPGSSASGGQNGSAGGPTPSNPGPNGSGTQNPPTSGGSSSVDPIDAIVELVIAILDLSLGPIRPTEIEGLVSAILVLSLAPAELAADSLIAVLDALDDTRICSDDPERCSTLCTNLEAECSACDHDHECIERIEEMCQVKLPKSCR